MIFMKTSSAKAKGRRLAAAVKALIVGTMNLSEKDVHVVPSGVTGEDLWLSERAEKVFPFAVECKNQENLNIWAALNQADGHNDERDGVVFFSRNRTPIYVAMSAEVFLAIVAKASASFSHGDACGTQAHSSGNQGHGEEP